MNNKLTNILQKIIEIVFIDNSNFNIKFDLLFSINNKDNYQQYLDNLETMLKKIKKKNNKIIN